jgi:ribosome-binding protein aMBF1 (putative translation factor)
MRNSPIPLPVERALRRVGHNVALARRRRHLSQEALAERIGASVNTVRRMEDGHPGTALQHVARALQVFGELDKFENLMDTAQDSVGLALMDEKLPQRIRTRRRPSESGAF